MLLSSVSLQMRLTMVLDLCQEMPTSNVGRLRGIDVNFVSLPQPMPLLKGIMTIAYDNVRYSNEPEKWGMATFLGLESRLF